MDAQTNTQTSPLPLIDQAIQRIGNAVNLVGMPKLARLAEVPESTARDFLRRVGKCRADTIRKLEEAAIQVERLQSTPEAAE